MTEDPHRQSCQRQHRVLGHFLAIQAWLCVLDCVVLVRRDLEVFLGLERFKSTRIQWLCDDLRPWFPWQVPYYSARSVSSLHSLFLSRFPIEEFLPSGAMTLEERIRGVLPGGPRTGRFSKDGDGLIPPSERDVIRYLAVLDSGLDAPKLLRGVRVAKQ